MFVGTLLGSLGYSLYCAPAALWAAPGPGRSRSRNAFFELLGTLGARWAALGMLWDIFILHIFFAEVASATTPAKSGPMDHRIFAAKRHQIPKP